MPIISVRDNESNSWKRNAKKTTTTATTTKRSKQTKTEKRKGDRTHSERVRDKWFSCAFKLGFLQLICKASLVFKSNLELALSIILKQRDFKTWVKACWGGVMTTSFANIAKTTASTRKLIY